MVSKSLASFLFSGSRFKDNNVIVDFKDELMQRRMNMMTKRPIQIMRDVFQRNSFVCEKRHPFGNRPRLCCAVSEKFRVPRLA